MLISGAPISGLPIDGLPAPPAAPTTLVATAGASSIVLTWTASVDADSYSVYRGTVSGGETLLIAGVASATYTDTAVVAGVTYYYEVTATNAFGESGYSNEATATISAAGVNLHAYRVPSPTNTFTPSWGPGGPQHLERLHGVERSRRERAWQVRQELGEAFKSLDKIKDAKKRKRRRQALLLMLLADGD